MYLVKVKRGIALATMNGINTDNPCGISLAVLQLSDFIENVFNRVLDFGRIGIIKILFRFLCCGHTVIEGIYRDLGGIGIRKFQQNTIMISMRMA